MKKITLRKMMLSGVSRVQMGVVKVLTSKREGIDGILVTVGLCIIALVLCVVMKDSLTTFIQTIVTNMTTKAQGILGS